MEKENRVEYIDILRGLGIIIMIMGHTGFGVYFDYFIHAFHMPLFFFLSGVFYEHKNSRDFSLKNLIFSKGRKLLIPYVVFGSVHYIVWLIIFGENDKTEPLKHLLFINTENMPIAGALWFLTALFGVNILYGVIDNYVQNCIIKNIVILILSLLGNFETILLPFRLPYAIGPALVGLGFYHLGYICAQKKYFVRENQPIFIWCISVILIGRLIFSAGYMNMRGGNYPNIIMFWIDAVLSILIGIDFAKWLDKRKCRIMQRSLDGIKMIGRNAITYMCLNELVIFLISLSPLNILNEQRGLYSTLVLIITMIILISCDYIIRHTKLKKILGK